MEENSDFYDKCYSKPNDYSLPANKSRFYKLWGRILTLLNRDAKYKILDVGCGTGQFAEMCEKRNYTYIGLDFSKVAIKIARKRKIKGAVFYCKDAFTSYDIIKRGKYDVITFIEFLEHVQKDTEILKCVPAGKIVMITLPKFGGHPHLRYFETVEDIKHRYENIIKFHTFKEVKKHFVVRGQALPKPKKRAKNSIIRKYLKGR